VISEHKNCDNAATNANSEKDRSIVAASSEGKRSYGGEEDGSITCTGHVWAAEFDHVTARSRLTDVLKPMNRLFI
jgi:hypothetical protein